jgi:hypothetical protein
MTADLHRLVPHPREIYLRQNEARIRSDALALKNDRIALRHLAGIEIAEDLQDYHETVIAHFRSKGLTHRIPPHELYLAGAFQLKLHHLDHLANLTL